MKKHFFNIFILLFFTLTAAQSFTLTKKYKKSSGIFKSLGIIKSELTNNTKKETYDLFYETLISAILRNPSLPKIHVMSITYDTLIKRDSVKISRKKYFTTSVPEVINFTSDNYNPDGFLIFKTFRIKAKDITSSTLNPKKRYTFLVKYFFWDNRKGEIAGYGTIEKIIERDRDHNMNDDYRSIAEIFSVQIVSDMKFLEK